MLHGWGADSSLMLPIAKRLDRYSIIPDLYGFGKTPHGDKPHTLHDYVLGVIEVLDKEGIDKIDVIGHSFGGRITIMLAFLHPERINKIVLCDSAGLKPRRCLTYYLKIINYKLRKKLGFSTNRCGSSDYLALSGVMRKTFVNVVNFDQSRQLSCVFAPTLIIWGKQDKQTPMYMAKKFKKKIKNSELFVLERAGHFSYADDIVSFTAKVNTFLGA